MNKIIYVLLLLISTSCICTGNKENRAGINKGTNTLHHIDINMNDIIDADNLLGLDSIIENVSFIPLEDNEGVILSEVNINLCKTDDKYIISSYRSNGILQFDSLGHYEKTIITKGKAKNELSSELYKWTYNKHNNSLTVSLGHKIVNYSFSQEKSNGISFDKTIMAQ